MRRHDAVLRVGGAWRVHGAIECLTRDASAAGAGDTWLADCDTRALRRVDRLARFVSGPAGSVP